MGRSNNKSRQNVKPLNIERILKDLKDDQPVVSIPAAPVVEKAKVTPNFMHNNYEYDSLKPEEKIKDFTGFIRSCLSQFEKNQESLEQSEREIQDILHYMEMTEDKKRQDGFNLYKRLTVARRERRRCKNEIELLHPVYELFHGTKLLDQLSQLQGSCRVAKAVIDSRMYNPRTDIIDQIIEKETKK